MDGWNRRNANAAAEFAKQTPTIPPLKDWRQKEIEAVQDPVWKALTAEANAEEDRREEEDDFSDPDDEEEEEERDE
jgi:hypothetical protein